MKAANRQALAEKAYSAGFELFREEGAHVDKCTAVVGQAARWGVEILFEAGQLQ